VRALSRELRQRAQVGPVVAVQGEGFLLGLRCSRPARKWPASCCAATSPCTSADPAVVRLLPPLISRRRTSTGWSGAGGDPRLKSFTTLRDFSPEQVR
jgi:acetylornithine/succinyldiaminopimelate/putrescine aminotransferase